MAEVYKEPKVDRVAQSQDPLTKEIRNTMAQLDSAKPHLEFMNERGINLEIVRTDASSRTLAEYVLKEKKVRVFVQASPAAESEKETAVGIVPFVVHEIEHARNNLALKGLFPFSTIEEETTAFWAGAKATIEIMAKYENVKIPGDAMTQVGFFLFPQQQAIKDSLIFTYPWLASAIAIYRREDYLQAYPNATDEEKKNYKKVHDALQNELNVQRIKVFYKNASQKIEQEWPAWMGKLESSVGTSNFAAQLTSRIFQRFELMMESPPRNADLLDALPELKMAEMFAASFHLDMSDIDPIRKKRYRRFIEGVLDAAKDMKAAGRGANSNIVINYLGFLSNDGRWIPKDEFNALLKEKGLSK